MKTNTRQIEIIPSTALTVSGGATPSVTSEAQDVSNADFTSGGIGLILVNSGISTSLTVTYQVGYKIPMQDASIVWVGGTTFTAISALTTVNVPGDAKYGLVTEIKNPCVYVRFKVANADAAKTATVRLIMMKQI